MTAWFQSALRHVRLRDALLLFAGDAVLLALLAAWLQVPDSHAWQFAFGMLCALALAAAFLWLHAVVLRSIRGASVALWISVVTLLPWALLWWKLCGLAGGIATNAQLRAGFWNSKFGPGMRHFFTYQRLQTWQLESIHILVWFVIPAVLLPFVVETVTQGVRARSWTAALRTLASWQHWVTLAAVSLVGCYVTGWILAWHPETRPWLEVVNLIIRIGLAAAIDVALVLCALAVDCELLRARHAAAADPDPHSV